MSAEDAAPLFDQILRSDKARALGCRPFGSAAVNALRVEKGFKVKADLDFAHWSEARVGALLITSSGSGTLVYYSCLCWSEAGVDAFIPDACKHEVLPFPSARAAGISC